jgi:hypothetical protein
MTEKPILFSTPMVIALLDGTKTQTRRIVKLPHNNPLGVWEATTVGGVNVKTSKGLPTVEEAAIWHTRTGDALICPHGGIGDQLWVRETWNHDCYPYPLSDDPLFYYRADYHDDPLGMDLELSQDGIRRKWMPSIFMPRAASRIQLEITNVRVERLNDISEADAMEEGVSNPLIGGTYDFIGYREGYQRLWEAINGAGSWDDNPWVWVVEFKRIKP